MSKGKFSDGTVASLMEIWTDNPMPKGGFTDAELDAVDLAEAEKPSGPNGKTLRKMISETYRCKTREEEDYYLRRFIASSALKLNVLAFDLAAKLLHRALGLAQ